jgi:hypothetical protein
MLRAIGAFIGFVILLALHVGGCVLFIWAHYKWYPYLTYGDPWDIIGAVGFAGIVLFFTLLMYTFSQVSSRADELQGGLRNTIGATLLFTLGTTFGGWGGVQFVAYRFPASRNLIDLGYLLGAVAGFVLCLIIGATLDYVSKSHHKQTLRGRALVTFKEAKNRAEDVVRKASKAQKHRPNITWGGFSLPPIIFKGHFCVVGAPGSGKTAMLTRLMQSVLPRTVSEPNTRALVYDAKRDIRATLAAMGIPDDRVRMLNPFDARSVAWNMAEDITEPGTALQVASILIPGEDGPNKFFSDAARSILTGVIRSFILTAPMRWTLRDLILACHSEDRLRAVLGRTAATDAVIEQYFKTGTTFESVKSTIASNMAALEPIAALWSHAKDMVSLRDWTERNYILILGNDDSLRAPLDAVNRLIFQRVTELLLSQNESEDRESWVFLDELKEAGQLNGLARLLTKGRSFGTRVAIGFQDMSGLIGVYGQHAASEIAGLCANMAFLKLDSAKTAEWSAEQIGEAEVREFTTTTNTGSQPGGSISEHITNRKVVLASELMNLPLPNERGFEGFYIVPTIGVYKTTCGYPELLRRNRNPNFIPRPSTEQYLDDWNDNDLARLGFPADRGDSSARPAPLPNLLDRPASPLDQINRAKTP